MIRKAKAVWRGTGRDGSGALSTDSGVLAETPYSFKTRFESEKGTNPEELIAAAHAGCFTMALAFQLQRELPGVQGTEGRDHIGCEGDLIRDPGRCPIEVSSSRSVHCLQQAQ